MGVISKGRVLGPLGCCGGYMCMLRTNRLAVMATAGDKQSVVMDKGVDLGPIGCVMV